MARLTYVCADPGVPVFGRKGSSAHVQEVVRALINRGAEVDLFAARLDGELPPGLEGVRVHRLPRPPKGELAARERAALAANRDLRAALEREDGFDAVYERYALWSHAGIDYARDHGIPGLLEVNAPLIEEQATHRGLADRAAAERVAGQVFGGATAILAVSGEVAEYVRRYPKAGDRVHVVPNGVDTGRFPEGLEPALPREAGTFTVGFVGTLKPWHGLGVLVEAFAALQRENAGARLLVVGDGPERENVERDLAERGLLGAARFTGSVAPEEIPGLLAAMDAAVAPYPVGESFYFSPLKAYEYLAAGLPVVASRVGQLDGLILDGENGLLCPPGDAGALADALTRLQNDASLREGLGARARASVLRKHTWGAVARRILELAGLEVPEPVEVGG